MLSVTDETNASSRATLADVARLASVAKSTVSRALTNDPTLNIRDETRRRIKTVAAELSYVPNPNARGLRLLRSSTIAFVVPELDNPVFGQTIEGAQRAAAERLYSMVIAKVDKNDAFAAFGRRLVLGSRVDGILLSTVAFDALLREFDALDAKVVLVNRRIGNAHDHAVMLDNAGGAALAVAHLAALGHRRIAYMAAPPFTNVSHERLEGYRRGLSEAGLDHVAALEVVCEPSAPAAEARARALLSSHDRPSAVVAWNLSIAAGVTRAAHALGEGVPERISVIALNDAGAAEMMTPSITTVRQPLFDLGWDAANALINRIEGRPREAASTPLAPIGIVERESTGPFSG